MALDPFPYDGEITSLDALWMGVPVIAKASGQRSAVTILNQIQRPEYLARDAKSYIKLALTLAADRETRQSLRQDLRSCLKQSLLCQADHFTARVENAYRQLWQEYLVRLKSDTKPLT